MNLYICNYVQKQSLSTVVVENIYPGETTTTKNGCRFVENSSFSSCSYVIIYSYMLFYCILGTVPSSQQQQQQQQHTLFPLVISLVVVAMADAVAASKRMEIEQKAISTTPKRSKILCWRTQYQCNSRLLAYRSQSTVEPIGLIVSLKLLL
jgi:hypothetical protein